MIPSIPDSAGNLTFPSSAAVAPSLRPTLVFAVLAEPHGSKKKTSARSALHPSRCRGKSRRFVQDPAAGAARLFTPGRPSLADLVRPDSAESGPSMLGSPHQKPPLKPRRGAASENPPIPDRAAATQNQRLLRVAAPRATLDWPGSAHLAGQCTKPPAVGQGHSWSDRTAGVLETWKPWKIGNR